MCMKDSETAESYISRLILLLSLNKKRENGIGDTLKKCGIDEGECSIKVCAAGFKQPELCGKPHWLSDFWASAYKIQDENGALALLCLNQSRM